MDLYLVNSWNTDYDGDDRGDNYLSEDLVGGYVVVDSTNLGDWVGLWVADVSDGDVVCGSVDVIDYPLNGQPPVINYI